MEVRISKPKTVAAALKPFTMALGDLKAVLAAEHAKITGANKALAAADSAHARAVKNADNQLADVKKTQAAITKSAQNEIEVGEKALGKINEVLGIE